MDVAEEPRTRVAEAAPVSESLAPQPEVEFLFGWTVVNEVAWQRFLPRREEHLQRAAGTKEHPASSRSVLPDTGVGMELERLVAPVFIQSPAYGTRASSAVQISRQGEPAMLEQVWQPDGQPATAVNTSSASD